MSKQNTLSALLLLCLSMMAKAEDGSRLWLRSQMPKDIIVRIDKTMPNDDGYRISGDTVTARTEMGLLYGKYAMLRGEQGESHPFFKLRILNHWDNLDGSIERGYAGNSIFWNEDIQLEKKSSLYTLHSSLLQRYAEACASIGINGTVLNNVNASPKILTKDYLQKVKEIADILRPWGIRVYLSVNFGSPKALEEVETADPQNPLVQRWWKKKAKQIYKLMPDFGGFLVKANSEGQPGPFDYGRSHADGANMLADALAPYGGIVMWRSFVYGAKHQGEDRVKQAVSEFAELDGQFRPNVILQSKNGPLDFQPLRPHEANTTDGRAADNPRVSGTEQAPCLSGSHVAGILLFCQARKTSRHSRCCQHRPQHQLVRSSLLASQLVRLWSPCMESLPHQRADSTGMAHPNIWGNSKFKIKKAK